MVTVLGIRAIDQSLNTATLDNTWEMLQASFCTLL